MVAQSYALGFAAAWDMPVGGFVVYKGELRKVLAVDRKGRECPYYRLEGVADGLISWQVCGAAWRCNVCHVAMANDYPSGVCSQSCLERGQGFKR